MTPRAALRDGREMAVRMATPDDGAAIAAVHPLPEAADQPETLYRNYYLAKTLIYTRAPAAGVMTGWLGEDLAGFIFYCADINAVGCFAKSPRTLLWLCGEALRGRFGYSPRFLLNVARWGLQHFRQPHDYDAESEGHQTLPDIKAWVGTVHTVEAHRRLGVASALMTAVEDALRDLGAEQVALWVADDNEGAQRLYEQRVYERLCTLPRMDEECALMVKDLRASEVTRPS